MYVSPDANADNKVEIIMETSIPAAYGLDMEGYIVWNYLSF
jgi:hypothetical protein